MKEVSCRVFQHGFFAADLAGIPRAAVLDGIDLPQSYLENPRNRVDWEVFVRAAENALRLVGSIERYIELYLTLDRDPSHQLLRRFIGWFGTPERLYRFVYGTYLAWDVSLFRTEFGVGANGSLEVHISIPADRKGCWIIFRALAAGPDHLARIFGFTPPQAELIECTPHRVHFRLHACGRQPLLARLFAGFRRLRASTGVNELLEEQNHELRTSHAQLERQMDESRALIEASGEAIGLVRDGRVLFANTALARLLRVPSAADLVGSSTERWLRPDDLASLRAWAAAGGVGGRREVVLLVGENATAYAEIAPPRTVTWGDQPAVLWMMADVTERRLLENAVAEASHREQRRIAHDLHDGLGQLLTGTAFKAKALQHELEGQGVASAAAAGELVELVNEATGQARDMAHGLAPVDVVPQAFAGALRHFAATTARVFMIDCPFSASGGDPLLDTRAATSLYRVVQEAVTNAQRHGRARRIEIDLVTDETELCLTVRDHGVGLPAGVSVGDGMGLRIMRHRVSTLGGSLHVGAADGGGVLVTIAVPLGRGAPATPENAVVAPGLSGATPTVPRRTNGVVAVVLIDDHPVVRAGVKQLFAGRPELRVCGEAGTSAEAEVVCARERPDVVLIDLLMGEGDNLGLIRRLRAAHPALRIVVLSMYAEEIYGAAAREAGADAYVMKQSPPEELLRAVRGT